MHDRAEHYAKGEIDDVNDFDPNLRFGDKRPAVIHQKYIPILDSLRKHPNGARFTEHKVAFDSEWYLTATSSRHAAFVAVLDAARVGGNRYDKDDPDNGWSFVYEWKSGQPKDTHVDQRKIYAMFAWRLWQQPVKVTTYYLEDTAPPQQLTLRSDEGYERLKALWAGRVKEMATNEICAPRPGYHCNWCDFAKKKGGPCIFG